MHNALAQESISFFTKIFLAFLVGQHYIAQTKAPLQLFEQTYIKLYQNQLIHNAVDGKFLRGSEKQGTPAKLVYFVSPCTN